MNPRDLYASIVLCDAYLPAREQEGIMEAALTMIGNDPLRSAHAEVARFRAGYGYTHRQLDRVERGLPQHW